MGYRVIHSHSINKFEQESIIMVSITDEQEKRLDDEGSLFLIQNDKEFFIEKENKPIYGQIDFNTNSDDYNVLETMNWLDDLTALGIPIPSNYNYKEHCCYSPTRKYKYYDTTNPAKVAQFLHASMGKPERVCIFRIKSYGYRRTE